MVCRGSVTALGSLLIIFAYDTRAGIACSAVLLPVAVANAWYFKRSRSVNRRLNNRLEREITALRTERERTIRRHYRALSRRRIILSDSEAATSLVMRLAALAAIILLILNMSAGPSSPGEMYALLAYAMMFFTGLVDIPLFVGAVGRYRDIMERLG